MALNGRGGTHTHPPRSLTLSASGRSPETAAKHGRVKPDLSRHFVSKPQAFVSLFADKANIA
jgi:hypothetical protein